MPESRSHDGVREARQVDNFFWHLEWYFEALDIDEEEKVQRTVTIQMELIFNRLDDLEVDSQLTVLERKVNVFAEELDDLIEEKVAHFTKWEAQRHNYLKGQLTELQEELATYKKKHEGSHKKGPHNGKDCPHKGKITAFLDKHKRSKGDSSNSDGEAHIGALQMVNAFVQKSKEEAAKRKKSKKKWGLLYPKVDVVKKTQEALVDTEATHDFMSPWVAEWLGLKSTKDGSWFTIVNAEERPTKGVVKNVDLRIGIWIGKADFNIINMDELGVVLEMDFMKKSSARLNPYCGVMMMIVRKPSREPAETYLALLLVLVLRFHVLKLE
ncbi:hypothetical protein RJ639_025147 [Escallonia herrerae]|uniref:Uncharacterized protein n=1 Tax=Escallonia herrerae TaxID=1293975 RepID=A0AA88SQN4_9ASTE|nr:hypothetical protein RJ639_025147 [Escallonia herrerae]